MKRIYIIFTILILGIFSAAAQGKPDANKIVQDRINNMKEHLKLSTAEGKTFWTAYEQYLRNEVKCFSTYRSNLEKKGIKSGCADCHGKSSSCDNLSDTQITYMFDQKYELKKNLLNLETSFYKKIKGILTPKHLQEFYKIDEQFKRTLSKNKATEQKSKVPTATPNKPRR